MFFSVDSSNMFCMSQLLQHLCDSGQTCLTSCLMLALVHVCCIQLMLVQNVVIQMGGENSSVPHCTCRGSMWLPGPLLSTPVRLEFSKNIQLLSVSFLLTVLNRCGTTSALAVARVVITHDSSMKEAVLSGTMSSRYVCFSPPIDLYLILLEWKCLILCVIRIPFTDQCVQVCMLVYLPMCVCACVQAYVRVWALVCVPVF